MLWCSAVLACAEDAWAEWPLFRNADEVQRHCPTDSVVWLDLQRSAYYVPASVGVATAPQLRSHAARKGRGGNRRSVLGRR
jgi:hypothetical protein